MPLSPLGSDIGTVDREAGRDLGEGLAQLEAGVVPVAASPGALAAGAGLVGQMIGYVIGREFGYWLLLRYGAYVRITESRIKLGEYLSRLWFSNPGW